MPKGKRKGRSDRHKIEGVLNSSEDESFNDNASVLSNLSENKSAEDGEENDDIAQENLEEKLIELLDGVTQKSSQGRTNCFQSLTKAFVKKCMFTFIKDRYFTICDGIERSLKKGSVSEKIAAVELATVICVQLGGEDSCEDLCKLFKPLLITIICDKTVSALLRAKCCICVGNITFLSGGHLGDVLSLMQQLESVFAGSYLKGDGNIANVTAELATLHAAAIHAWCLLFTLITPGSIGTMIKIKSLPSLTKLSQLLESPHLDVRLAGGEALALVYESGRIEDPSFEEEFAVDIIDTLKQLATDSHKYRAKKDRKQQRATFRDILQFIENDTVPEVQVKFGKETLTLDSWARRVQYETLCNILGPSINVHLTENDLLRDIFELLEPPPSSDMPAYALHQMERNRKRLLNAANFKARTISRAKNRDKRSDF